MSQQGLGCPGWGDPGTVWDASLGRVGRGPGQDWGARLRGSSRDGSAGFGRSQWGLGYQAGEDPSRV